jgi:hypothetical protein
MMHIMHASPDAERIEVGGSTLDVFIDSGPFELGTTPLLDWVTRSANARLSLALSKSAIGRLTAERSWNSMARWLYCRSPWT